MQTIDTSRQAVRGSASARAVRALVVLPLPVVALAVALLALSPGLPMLVIVAIVVVLDLFWSMNIVRAAAQAEDQLLAGIGAREADADAFPRMHNLVDGLCLTIGVNKPHVWTVRSEAPLALVVSQSGSPGSLVFSDGLLGSLDRVESEALAAHMLVRLRSGDAEAASVVIALWRTASRFGLGRVASVLLSRSVALEPVHLVDAAACRITRYPPGLSSVLARFGSVDDRAVATDVPDHLRGLLAPLLVAEPGSGDAYGGGGLPSLEPVRLTAGERIELIKEY